MATDSHNQPRTGVWVYPSGSAVGIKVRERPALRGEERPLTTAQNALRGYRRLEERGQFRSAYKAETIKRIWS